MKKVLILSCNTGQGHNSCAQALKEYFEEQGVTCDIQDTLRFISPRFSRFIAWGHSFTYRHLPDLFRWGYRYSENHPALFRNGSWAYCLLTAGVERMYSYISSGGYDVLVSCHAFSAMILTRMLELHPMPVQTAFIATDYTCSPSIETSDLQYYFIPDESLSDEFAGCGIPGGRIIAAGIPVRRAFAQKTERADAKRLLGIGAHNRHLLIMCGSMGCGPIAGMVKHISRSMPAGAEVSVICGTNRRLCRKLTRRYNKRGQIHIVGYSSQIPLYMDSADLYLTKPGGVSVTEALAKRLPMVFVNAVAGCEQYNMDYFVNMGAAVTAGSLKGLAERCVNLLGSDCERQRMSDALAEHAQPLRAEALFRTLSGGKI